MPLLIFFNFQLAICRIKSSKADISSKLSLHWYYSVKNTSAVDDIFMMWVSCKIWRGGILGNQAFGSDGNTQVHRIRRRKYTDGCFGPWYVWTGFKLTKKHQSCKWPIKSYEGARERIYSYFQDVQKQCKVYWNFFLSGCPSNTNLQILSVRGCLSPFM